MKKLPLACCLFLLTSACLRADWVVVQKTTTNGQTMEGKMQIKETLFRADQGDQMSVIVNSAKGSAVMLMHPQKMMMKLDGEPFKRMMTMAAAVASGSRPVEKPKATGEKEKVGDYQCEIYTWSGKIGSGKFWVTSDFKGYQELNAASDKLMQAMGNQAAALAPKASDFPGMVVKSEGQAMGQTVTTELVSAKEEPVDDAVFALPEGYSEMAMPALPGAK